MRQLFRGARFLTPNFTWAEAMAVDGGRIAALGAWPQVERSGWPVVDLGGGVVVPGFNDAHVHVWKVGHLLTSMLDLRGVDSLVALQTMLASHASDGWIQGRGFNEARMGERRMPTRADLDAVVPHRPVMLTRTCGHIAVVNSEALRLAGVSTQTDAPAGGVIMRDERGEPTGVLQETAMGLVGSVIPAPTADEYARMIAAAARRHLTMGITSVTEAGASPELIEVYRAMADRGALAYRVNLMALRRSLGAADTLPLPTPHTSDFLRIDTVKLFADGGLSGATAAVREAYVDGSHGVLRMNAEELDGLARDACRAGLRIAVHAIGDAAIDEVLEALSRLRGQGFTRAPRIEHFGLPHEEQISRAKELGVVAVPQAIFIRALGANFRARISPATLSHCYPLRAMLDANLVMALSSDAPVVPDENPLLGMQAALLRDDEEGNVIAAHQSITVAQALRAYTLGGAQASGDEANRGELAPGKWADFAVLSANPMETEGTALTSIRVTGTYVAGVRMT